MRVAMIVQSFAPVLGGAQRQIEQLGPALRSRGHTVLVATRRAPGTPRHESAQGLDIRRIRVPRSGHLAPIVYSAVGAASVAAFRPDVIHAHGLLSPATVAMLASRARRAPVVAKVLAAGPGGDLERLFTKPFAARRLREMIRRVSAFVALSADVEAELVEHGIDPARIRRIPNGVDTARFRPAETVEREELRARLGLQPEHGLALYCGRYAGAKRLDVILEAWKSVPDHQLVLLGDGEEEARLLEMSRHPALAGRVLVKGVVADTAPFLRAADVYVSASSTEGMSGSVMEAMASGIPVVAARASGMEELLGGGAGILLEEVQPAGFAEALGKLLSDDELRRRLGSAGRSLIEKRYSVDSVAERLDALYEEVRR